MSGAGLPFIFWQEPIGSPDWHLIGDMGDLSMLERVVEAGAIAMLFEHIAHRGESNPDDIRASGALGTTPPASHPAGGRASDMRDRVASHSTSPLTWPTGSICGNGNPPDQDSGVDGGVEHADLDTTDHDPDSSQDAGADGGGGSPASDGCSCSAPSHARDGASQYFVALILSF